MIRENLKRLASGQERVTWVPHGLQAFYRVHCMHLNLWNLPYATIPTVAGVAGNAPMDVLQSNQGWQENLPFPFNSQVQSTMSH